MAALGIIESITLILSNDRHQKQYNVELVEAPGGFVVNFAFGAIGKALQPGTKTKTAVPFDQAKKAYDRLVAEKTGKRCECCMGCYVPTEHREAISSPVAQRAIIASPPCQDRAPRRFRFEPELLSPVDVPPTSKTPDPYTSNDRYGAMKKFDGIRLGVDYNGVTCVGYNRKGEPVTVPAPVEAELRAAGISVMLDGEWISSVGMYVAFDLLEVGGADWRQKPFVDRHAMLSGVVDESDHITVALLSTGTTAKRILLQVQVEVSGEGVVYKKLAAPYMPGRQGVNTKRKLWASATVRIRSKRREDGKNSFEMEMFQEPEGFLPAKEPTTPRAIRRTEKTAREGRWVSVGTCTCTKTVQIPESGKYREIKYLYCGAGGNLVQAEDLGPREDVGDADCGFAQLKRKQTEGVAA